MPHYLSVKDRLKDFRKAGNQSYRGVVWKIGAVTLLRDRLNVSKLPARSIGWSRDTDERVWQAVSELWRTYFKNTRRDSIWTVSLPRIKDREDNENVIMNNFLFRDEVVRGWRSRRNIPSIIQSRVGSKCLSKEFCFRERQLWSRLVEVKEGKMK